MGVPLLPVWKLPAHPRRIPWSTTGGFLASPPRAHASPRAGSPLVPGVENRHRLAVGADESAYLFRAPSTSPRRNGPESACRRFQGPRRSLEEIQTRPQPVRGLSRIPSRCFTAPQESGGCRSITGPSSGDPDARCDHRPSTSRQRQDQRIRRSPRRSELRRPMWNHVATREPCGVVRSLAVAWYTPPSSE